MNENENQRTTKYWVILATLIAVGVAIRIVLRDIPNVAPVAGLALFAGYFFNSKRIAFLVPISIMVISDQFIGGYEWGMMLAVYLCLSIPVLFGRGIQRLLPQKKSASSGVSLLATSSIFAILSSFLFFGVTNFVCWLTWYEGNIEGFANCYLLALPFLKNTIIGDQIFTLGTFGVFLVVMAIKQIGAAGVHSPACEN